MKVLCRALLLCLLTHTNSWSDVCLLLSVIACTSSGWWYLSDMHVSLLTVNVCVWMGQFPAFNVRFSSGYSVCVCVCVCVCVWRCQKPVDRCERTSRTTITAEPGCVATVRLQSGNRVSIRERKFSFLLAPSSGVPRGFNPPPPEIPKPL